MDFKFQIGSFKIEIDIDNGIFLCITLVICVLAACYSFVTLIQGVK